MRREQNSKIEDIEKLGLCPNDTSIEEIMKYVNDKDRATKLTAIETLAAFAPFKKAKEALVILLDDRDSEYRYYAMDSITSFWDEEVERAIAHMLVDSDVLIRINAAQILGNEHSRQSIASLMEALNDKNELVRGYAAESLGKMGIPELANTLERMLSSEARNATRLRIYHGLVSLGKTQYIDKIIDMLFAKSYKVRSAAANILPEIANETNGEYIIQCMKKALSKESTIAVKSSLLASLRQLCAQFNIGDCSD